MSAKTQSLSQIGVKYFGFLAAGLGQIVREVNEHDVGIDIDLEIKGAPTLHGKTAFVGVQVKSRTKAKKLTNGNYTISVSRQNVDYWARYGRPVILILYEHSNSQMCWARVDQLASRTVHISPANAFDAGAIEVLRFLCEEYVINLSKNLSLLQLNPPLSRLAETYADIGDALLSHLNNAYQKFENTKYQDSAEDLHAVLKIFPNSMHVMENYVLSLTFAGDSNALSYASKLIDKAEPSTQELQVAATAIARFGDFDEARKLFQMAINKDSSSRAKSNLALACYWRGFQDEAFNLYSEIQNTGIVDETLCFNMGLISTAKHDYLTAIEFYDKAIAIKKDFADAYNNKGLLLQHTGKHEDAMNCFSLGCLTDRANISLFINYGRLLKDYGRNEEALLYFDKSIEIKKENCVLRDKALIFCRLNQLERANILFQSVKATLVPPNLHEKKTKDKVNYLLIDAGFSVLYTILLEIEDGAISVKRVADFCNLSILKAFEKAAHENGIPFEMIKGAFDEREIKVR